MPARSDQIALAERIEARHKPFQRYGNPAADHTECMICRNAPAWPCDAALAAGLLRESAQREAEANAAMGERPASWTLADAIRADHAALDDAKEIEESLRDEIERLKASVG